MGLDCVYIPPIAKVEINGRTCACTCPGFFYVPLASFV